MGNIIRDHPFVLTRMKVRIPDTKVIEREVWNFKKADWTKLRECLAEHNWSGLYNMDADDAARAVTSTILKLVEECIGKRTMKEYKSTHPWLTRAPMADWQNLFSLRNAIWNNKLLRYLTPDGTNECDGMPIAPTIQSMNRTVARCVDAWLQFGS